MKGKTLAAGIKLVIFTVLTAIATALLAFAISNADFAAKTTYRAVFSDATDLLTGDDVRIAGVRVGTVTGVDVYARKYALVTFGVNKDIPVRKSSELAIRYRNLVGQRYVELIEGPGSDAALPAGATIPMAQTKPALDLTVLFDGFRPLFQALDAKQVNTLSYEIVSALQGEGGTVDTLVQTTASLTTTLASRDKVIGEVIDNLNGVLATVDARNEGLSSLIGQLQRLVTGLAGDRQTIAASLGNINNLATSTSSLVSGIRPVLPSDLANLSAVAKTLNTTKSVNGGLSLDDFLTRFPGKLNAIVRTATYGSFFNFWLCDADFVTGDGTNNQKYSPVQLHNNDQVCQPGGTQK